MKVPAPRIDATPPEPIRTDVILLDIIEYTLQPNEMQYRALFYLNRIIGTITCQIIQFRLIVSISEISHSPYILRVESKCLLSAGNPLCKIFFSPTVPNLPAALRR